MCADSHAGLRLAVVALSLAVPAIAQAADPEPPPDAGVLRTEDEAGSQAVVPQTTLEPRFSSQLGWSRWMLADTTPDERQRQGANLPVTDLRADTWQLRSESARSAISALGSVAAGVPIARTYRNGKLRARHYLRAFFRSSGASLVLRIEF